MIVAPGFAPHLAYLDAASLSLSADVICVIDADYILRAYNRAWLQFAENNGGANLPARFGLGQSIMSAIPEPLRSFYATRYRQALAEGRTFDHDYECSSPELQRYFHQTAYPLVDGSGLLISHHLLKTGSAGCEYEASPAAYRGDGGDVVQCMNCRKVRQPAKPEQWDWVPALVARPAAETSHTICPRCLDFYYPDLPDEGSTTR